MKGDLPSTIANLRRELGLGPGMRLATAQELHPDRLEALADDVVDRVGRYPVTLLQRFGAGSTAEEVRFIYTYGWQPQTTPPDDASIVFQAEAASHLVALAGLLRPLIHREWARFVASKNQLQQQSIEDFLFGTQRRSLRALHDPLREFYDGRCFYCRAEMPSSFQIDHFLPWSKYPDDRLDNLVPAHTRCNNAKRDALAATEHLERWWVRFEPAQPVFSELERLAAETQWPRDPEVTGRAARGLYLHQGHVGRLWVARGQTAEAQPSQLRDLLLGQSPHSLSLAAEDESDYHTGN